VATSLLNIPRIIEHLPDRMTHLDPEDVDEQGRPTRKRSRIIVAGGEVLLEPIRERVLYPALRQLGDKYRDVGGVELIVQTTGDLLKGRYIDELLDAGVSVISVSGIDAYHAGLEKESARERLTAKLTSLFRERGLEEWVAPPLRREGTRYFHFFGATPESWIGKLWPRGRAHLNELSTANINDNFCNGWSGGLGFLRDGYKGSEVSIDPDGNVYPCCMKTKLPVGNLLTDRLQDVIARVKGNPVYEAISAGQPQLMGLAHGWSVEKFMSKSKTVLPSGRSYENLCVGCDRFHDEVLSPVNAAELVQIEV
jgi:MoaA/NifB/PqqE/SkfB family radical SAM enzyme